ncbi:MAG: tetratricopeptide repeat protein [Bacillota bacterium]
MKFFNRLILNLITLSGLAFSFISAVSAQNLNSADKIDMLLFKGKYNEALPLIDAAIKSDSLNPDLYYKAGIARQSLYQHEKALQFFIKAAAIDSGNAVYYYSLGKSYSALGYDMEALPAYKKAYQNDPRNKTIAFTLIGTLTSENFYEEAISLTNDLLKQDSADGFIYSQLAYCYMKTDSLALAVSNYEKAYQLNSSDLSSMQQLIILYIKLGKLDQANHLIDYGLNNYPKISAYPKLKAEALFKAKDFENAANYYNSAIAMGDSSAVNFQKLGISYYSFALMNDSISYNRKVKFYTKSKDALMKAYRKEKNNPFVIYYLGVMNARIGEYNAAVNFLEEALGFSIASFTHEIYSYLGECYRVERNYEEAIDAYKMSLTLNPENITVFNNLCTIYSNHLKDDNALLIFLKEFRNSHRDLNEKLKNNLLLKIEEIEKPSGRTGTVIINNK